MTAGGEWNERARDRDHMDRDTASHPHFRLKLEANGGAHPCLGRAVTTPRRLLRHPAPDRSCGAGEGGTADPGHPSSGRLREAPACDETLADEGDDQDLGQPEHNRAHGAPALVGCWLLGDSHGHENRGVPIRNRRRGNVVASPEQTIEQGEAQNRRDPALTLLGLGRTRRHRARDGRRPARRSITAVCSIT